MVNAATTKAIAIVVLGAGETSAAVKDVTLHPGMTVAQALQDINLGEYRLSRGKGTPFFDDDDNLFALAQDGEKLYASTMADQG